MSSEYIVPGDNGNAAFTLAVHRGEGMCLLAMNWKNGQPPANFAGFAIEYKEPRGKTFIPVKNRLCFPGKDLPPPEGEAVRKYPSTEAPFQSFRWVHFPNNADKAGNFTYRVTAMFSDALGNVTAGDVQSAKLALARETYPGVVNIAFTRGYVSSQAFVDQFGGEEGFDKLIPKTADEGLEFDPMPPHSKAPEAYQWMGFESRKLILDLLQAAVDDTTAQVAIAAYELNLPEVVHLLEQLGSRLRIILDDSIVTKKENGQDVRKSKGDAEFAESKAAVRILAAGGQVVRQHMGKLQHNKMIIVTGNRVKKVVCGSTNFSWRGFYVQGNNAVVLEGDGPVAMQMEAFEDYWSNAAAFKESPSAAWRPLHLPGLDASIAMSPHANKNAVQNGIAQDIRSAQSSLLYSLAFLSITPGVVTEAIEAATDDPDVFVYGISDKKKAIVVNRPDGNPQPVSAAALTKNLPEPFKSEAGGGSGVKMHHKFVVLDFNTPQARVYTGSFNFSTSADTSNGENLLLFKDRRIATSYMIEAIRIFDSYAFRGAMKNAKKTGKTKNLMLPPSRPGEVAWWDKFYTRPVKVRDRLLFSALPT